MVSDPSETPTNRPQSSGQDDLEAALAALRQGDDPGSSPPDLLDQQPIDALLARDAAESIVQKAPHGPIRTEDGMDAPVSPGAAAGPLLPSDLDSVLAGEHADAPLNDVALDDLLNPAVSEPAPKAPHVDQSEIDALIKPSTPLTPAPSSETAEEVLETLFATPATPRPDPSIGAENLAAAAHAAQPDTGLSQDLLDALLAEAEGASVDAAPKSIAEPAASPSKPTPPPQPQVATRTAPEGAAPAEVQAAPPSVSRSRVALRLAASIAVGVLVGASTYFYLTSHPYRSPDDLGGMTTERLRPLEHATRVAQTYIDGKEYDKAQEELAGPLAEARPSRERTDAEYVYLDAAFRGLKPNAESAEIDELHNRIDRLVQASRSHDRAPEALLWKAHLYDMEDLPLAAKAVYRQILQNYPMAKGADEILYDAGENALALKDYETAAGYLQRLLNEHGSSALAGPGKLLLGDAYRGAGQTDSARVIYIQVAESNATKALGGEAHARLGSLAYHEGRYQDAIAQLEARRETATSVEGNEQVYLLLAKAHRAAGEPGEAEVVLRELIDFFPENPYTPEAYVELSQVLEERGMRQEALRLARRTALSYPNNPLVFRNLGVLLANAGLHAEAADSLVAAEAAGDRDPKLLLSAAQNYQKADSLDQAATVFEDLITRYAVSPEAFEAGIALAEVDQSRGRIKNALERLENLATVSEGKPQYLAVLTSLGDLYTELGLDGPAAQTFSRAAAVATDSETLAKAATALFRVGALDEGIAVANRVERSDVSPSQAYELLMRHGEALLRLNPDRALTVMEEAYAAYPEEHTADWGQRLLEAYLTADRSAYARRLVMDIEADARENPVRAPDLIGAAIAYADYLYERQDYRAAADAYALVPESADPEMPDVQWARYQYANALLQLGDFEGSIPRFDALAAGKGRWAKDAAIKSDYARVEQRMRGMRVTPRPGQVAQVAP